MRWLLIVAAAMLALPVRASSELRGRSATIVADAARVVVVNPDSLSLTLVDLATRAKMAEIEIGSIPQTLHVAGDRAFVATRDGRIVRVELVEKSVTSARVGTELFGIVSDGTRLFVSDYGASSIRVVDATTLEPLATIATEEYPRGLALEGPTLYVTHFRSGRVSVIDTATLAVARVITTEVDGNLAQALVVDGGRAYAPQTRSNATNPAILFDTTVFPVVSVIDLAANAAVPKDRFSLDVIDRPVNMPLDALITPAGKLYVVNSGSDDVSVIDLAQRKRIAHIETGSHPRGIALSPDGALAFVANALSGTITVIDTATDTVAQTIDVTTLPLDPRVLNGKILFHASSPAKLAQDQWISCATCHFEGGADGRTWLFRDGPRNTTALFGVLGTLPMHWSGDLDELQDVEQTIRVIQSGSGLAHGGDNCAPACNGAAKNRGRSLDLDDLAAFMASLHPPRRDDPGGDAARRGELLFLGNGCASCHPAPLYTDRSRHDVGTGTELERKGTSFDTPSLRGLFDTAPYFHDGSAATLAEVLARHGDASALSAAQRDDLIAFLKSIPFPRPKRRSMRSP